VAPNTRIKLWNNLGMLLFNIATVSLSAICSNTINRHARCHRRIARFFNNVYCYLGALIKSRGY
jgi:hypothetical protein